jgi:hypothetical protein
LIDCLPIGQAAQNADTEIFALARALVNQANPGVDDYRQIDFGKGPGVFCSAVAHVLAEGSWETLYVDSRSADAMHAITLLTTRAAEVIRGL